MSFTHTVVGYTAGDEIKVLDRSVQVGDTLALAPLDATEARRLAAALTQYAENVDAISVTTVTTAA